MNFWSYIKQKFERPTSFYGCHLHEADSQFKLVLQEFKLSRLNELEVLETYRIESLDELNAIPARPCYLLISGRRVISKSIESEEVPTNELFRKAFPSLNPSEVYFEVFNQNKESHTVSVIRKSSLAKIFDEWPQTLPILNLRLGLSFMSRYLKGISDRELYVAFHVYNAENESFKQANLTSEVEVAIQGEVLKSNTVGAFLVGVNGMVEQAKLENLPERIKTDYSNMLFKNVSRQLVWPSLIMILTSLIFSFFVFSHFNQSLAEKEAHFEVYKQKEAYLLELQKRYLEKQEFFTSTKTQAAPCFRLINELGNTVPPTISLSLLEVNPLLKSKPKKGVFEFEIGVIWANGTTKEIGAIEQWQNAVYNHSWIHDFSVRGYREGSKEAEFNLALKISDS